MKKNSETTKPMAVRLERWVGQAPCKYLDFVWVSNFYDLPLSGICRYRGSLHRFETDYDTGAASIFRLTLLEKLRWLYRKKKFEWCVGYHFSYPQRKNGALFYWRRPEWFWRLLFKAYYRRR